MEIIPIPCKYEMLKKAKKELNINPKNYMNISMFLDSTADKARLSGRRCSVIVGSAIYLFCKETQGFTQKQVAGVTGITEVSIRNTMRVLIQYMPKEYAPELVRPRSRAIEL